MIHEYALEPSLLNNWERFRYFVAGFGISQGRLISRYPKRWKRMVHEALDECTDIQKARIVERMTTIDDLMFKRTQEWNTEADWLSNAEAEHGKRPFHAILAAKNARGHTAVLIAADLDDKTPLWAAERERVIDRKAGEMANAVAPLLALGPTLVFVDPYFDPFKTPAAKTMRILLEKAFSQVAETVIERVEIHTRFDMDKSPAVEDFLAKFKEVILNRFVFAGVRVSIKRWQEYDGGEGLHNRYILTERGGVRFAWGLDEGDPTQTDDISLLDHKVFQQRWNQYCGEHPAFDLIDSIQL
jgi:hypothetical protein